MPDLNDLNDLVKDGLPLKGAWKLDDRHQLTYRADGDGLSAGYEASLVAAEPDALVVLLNATEKGGRVTTRLARLSGRWQANDKNQIEFMVERQTTQTQDTLTFTGHWQAGPHNELTYTWKQTTGLAGAGPVTEQRLVFKGYWDITEKNRLSYLFETDCQSAFHFRGTLQSTGLGADEGKIRFELGVEAEGRERCLQTLTLTGRWLLTDELTLNFEMQYENGASRTIRFGAQYALKHDVGISAQLLSRTGQPLGLEVAITKDLPGSQAQLFLRLRKSLGESAVEAGITIPL